MRDSAHIAAMAALAIYPCMAQNASVHGQVTNSITREPVPRVHVHLANQSRQYGASTDAQGNFSFDSVIPDSYQASADKIGFTARPESPIVEESSSLKLDSGVRHSAIHLELIPLGAISGRVLDANGFPMERVSVTAIRGRTFASDIQTNERGEFRMPGLLPGKYRIKAQKEDLPIPPEIRTDGTVEVHYASTWYPGVVDPGSAGKVEVQAGNETDGVEIRMATSSIAGVRGKVNGMPPDARDVSVWVARTGYFGLTSEEDEEVAPNGTFEIWRLDPGRYQAIARGSTAADRRFETAPEEFEIAGSTVENLQLTVVPFAALNGRVEFEDEQTRERLSKLELEFADIDGESGSQSVDADGDRFQIRELGPSRFHISVGAQAYVKSMRLGRTGIDGPVLDLRRAPEGDELVLLVSSNMGSVAGTVRDDKGTPVRAWLTLTPKNSIPDTATVSFVEAKDDGTYSLERIAPGKYKLLALEKNLGFFFYDFEDAVQEIEVRAGERTSQDLICQHN